MLDAAQFQKRKDSVPKMKSHLRNFAISGIVAISAITIPAQAQAPIAAPAPLIAESTTPPRLWPDAPEPMSASAAFVMPVPVRQPRRNLATKALGLFAWPGYAMLGDARDEDQQGLKTILLIERGTALFDGASTYIMLDTPYLPNAIHASEADPLMTLFGNRNKLGVLGSGSFLESLVNGGSVAIPQLIDRKMGARAGHIACITTILADGALSMVHIQLAIYNLKGTARLLQSVNAVNGN
jgi:hypothetical protein